jgi:hypothetical protein
MPTDHTYGNIGTEQLSVSSVGFISLSSNIQEPEDWKQFAMSISAWLHQIDSTFIA